MSEYNYYVMAAFGIVFGVLSMYAWGAILQYRKTLKSSNSLLALLKKNACFFIREC